MRQRVKAIIKDWLPPALLRYIQAIRGQKSQPAASLPEWEYARNGWDSYNGAVGGWNQPGVAETYAAHWRRFLDRITSVDPLGVNHESGSPDNNGFITHNQIMTLGYVVGRTAHKRDRLSILDFGGALGHHLAFLQVMFPNLTFDYSCCEFPLVCKQGRQLHPSDQVHFFEDDAWRTHSYDLVISDASLQYIRSWQETLARLAKVSRSAVLITRIPVAHTCPSFVILQRAWSYGYGTEYLGWCFNKAELLDIARQNVLSLKREFLVYRQDPLVPNAPENPHYMGFLFDKG